MTKYLLIPQWRVVNHISSNPDDYYYTNPVPIYFLKLFNTKKEVEDYLNNSNIRSQIHATMVDAIHEAYKDNTEKSMKRCFEHEDIVFWVISINDIGKANRIGIVQKSYSKKTDSCSYKYQSYFGGKVWKDYLLGRVYV